MRVIQGSGPSSEVDPWDVLDLPAGTAPEEIKARYRQLVAAKHPDKLPGDPEAEGRFKQITVAYRDLVSRPASSRIGGGGDRSSEASNEADRSQARYEFLQKFGWSAEGYRDAGKAVVAAQLLFGVALIFGLFYFVAFESRTFEQEFGFSLRPKYTPDPERLLRGAAVLRRMGLEPDPTAYTEEERDVLRVIFPEGG